MLAGITGFIRLLSMKKRKVKKPLVHAGPGLTAADLCQHTRSIDVSMRNAEVFELLDADPAIQCLPVIDRGVIIGMINRESFMRRMTKRFHWELYSKKHCTKMMDLNPLVVDAETSISEVAVQLLGDGERSGLSESFIISKAGQLLGAGYTRDVLATLLKHERHITDELMRHQNHLEHMVEERTLELIRARDAAEYANRAKSEFLANITHELRTPLHGILAFAELGQRKHESAPREKLRVYFETIHESGARLTRLVNHVLELTRLASGQAELLMADADLGLLAEKAIGDHAALAAQRRIRVQLECGAEPLPLYCDADRISWVIFSLLDNALKFTRENTAVRLSVCADDGPGSGYQLQIMDEGPGIPEGELCHIFEQFTQSSQTRTGAGGTGLGLTIAHHIITLHQGEIVASNLAAGGACFTIRLPATQRPKAPSGEQHNPSDRLTGSVRGPGKYIAQP